MQIITLLSPIFLTIALGAILQRSGFFGSEFLSGANKLTYWVGLPVLVMVSLATAEHGEGQASQLLFALVLGTFASVGVAWVAARVLRVRTEARGTWIQAAFRGNVTFVGLPMILTMPNIPRTAAILSMAPLLIVYNTVSVGLLVTSGERTGPGVKKLVLSVIFRNPVVIASAVGGLIYAFNIRLWLPVERSLIQVSQLAVPLALLCIGGALATTPFKGNRRAALGAALFKTAVSPLVGYGLARLFHLDRGETLVVLLLMACPTSAISYTMVRQLGGDEAIAASTIVLSTLLSAIALAVVLAVS